MRDLRRPLQWPEICIYPEVRQPLDARQESDDYACEALTTANVLYMFGDELDVDLDALDARLDRRPGEPLAPGVAHWHLLERGYKLHVVHGPEGFDTKRFYNEGAPYWREFMATQPQNAHQELTDEAIEQRRREMELPLACTEHPNYSEEVSDQRAEQTIVDLLLGGYVVDLAMQTSNAESHAVLAWGFRAVPHADRVLLYDPADGGQPVHPTSLESLGPRLERGQSVIGIKRQDHLPADIRQAVLEGNGRITSPVADPIVRQQLRAIVDRLRWVVDARTRAANINHQLDWAKHPPIDLDTTMQTVSDTVAGQLGEVATALIARYDKLFSQLVVCD